MHAGDRIPEAVLDEAVVGANLAPGTLRDQLGPGPTLLVFLRHLGCVFCRETIASLREASAARPDYPPVLFFFQGTPTEGRVLLSRFWSGARAVADRSKRFYEAFGVARGSLVQLMGPSVWRARRRALEAGFAQGERAGDVRMMPGLFWVEDGRVVWRHAFRHAGDVPDFTSLPDQVARLSAARSPARAG